jgi:hypothetical protein
MYTNQVVYIVKKVQLKSKLNRGLRNSKKMSNKNRDIQISNQAHQFNFQNSGKEGKFLLLQSLAEAIESDKKFIVDEIENAFSVINRTLIIPLTYA